jgi:hypothetical protein
MNSIQNVSLQPFSEYLLILCQGDRTVSRYKKIGYFVIIFLEHLSHLETASALKMRYAIGNQIFALKCLLVRNRSWL